MFEKYTEKSIKVIMLAQEEARRLGHNYVSDAQILLGLSGEGTGIAAKTLKHFGIILRDARVIVENILGQGNRMISVEIPFTTGASRVLECAWEEAKNAGHNYVGTEHLLLGLLSATNVINASRDKRDCAYKVLEAYNLLNVQLRHHIFQMMGETGSNPSPITLTELDRLIAQLQSQGLSSKAMSAVECQLAWSTGAVTAAKARSANIAEQLAALAKAEQRFTDAQTEAAQRLVAVVAEEEKLVVAHSVLCLKSTNPATGTSTQSLVSELKISRQAITEASQNTAQVERDLNSLSDLQDRLNSHVKQLNDELESVPARLEKLQEVNQLLQQRLEQLQKEESV